jgi:effector-binding domain-containing protein
MKKLKLVVHQPSINKLIGRELNLSLNDNANIIDAIIEVDKMIKSKGSFPIQDYGSLLHMIYNPIENRFYKQVAITANTQSGKMLNVRDNLEKELPEGVTVILIPAGGCIGEWEEATDYEEFLKTITH